MFHHRRDDLLLQPKDVSLLERGSEPPGGGYATAIYKGQIIATKRQLREAMGLEHENSNN